MTWYETYTRSFTLSRSLGWIRRWKGDSDLCDDETVRAVLSECLSPLPHPVPILAGLDPSCERFSFRTFWIHLQWLWTLLAEFFEFETICMSDIIFVSSHTLITFSTKVRISWNSWPLFSCWLQSCDVCLRLGSCVCECVCSVLLCCLFVVGWQQHRSYSVIDAMVYLKNWRLEDERHTGKTVKSVDWVWIRNQMYDFENLYFNSIWHEDRRLQSWLTFIFGVTWVLLSCMHGRISEFGTYGIFCMSWARLFWMMLHHLYCVIGRAKYLLIVFWSRMWSGTMNTRSVCSWMVFSSCGTLMWSGWDVMPKGGMEIWHPVRAPFG